MKLQEKYKMKHLSLKLLAETVAGRRKKLKGKQLYGKNKREHA